MVLAAQAEVGFGRQVQWTIHQGVEDFSRAGEFMAIAREDRMSGEPHSEDARTPFQIDRDRLLYSTPFRRLAGVTQVVSPGEGEIFHNRLTHSLKVAQVARRLAERLHKSQPEQAAAWGGLDPDVTEAAALAHDLGHPPFGHGAEKELTNLIAAERSRAEGTNRTRDTSEGYEGNAQSFRVITELAVRRRETAHGLDLTRATLNATLKYPWTWRQNPADLEKYGAYECDNAAFQFARAGPAPTVPDSRFVRSLEAQIMDWADDITYSVHDTEDFYRAGLIPLDGLASNARERNRFLDNVVARALDRGRPIELDRNFNRVFSGLFDTLKVREPYEGTRGQQELLYDFVSSKINQLVKSTTLADPPGAAGDAICCPEEFKLEIFLLKELTWEYVIANPLLAAHRLGRRRAIQTLFREFNQAVIDRNWALFPAYFRERARRLHEERRERGEIPCAERVRLVSDTISSLTDRQALIIYHHFSGLSVSSIVDPSVS
jgi:dGTPase